jgi:hypothetical protein
MKLAVVMGSVAMIFIPSFVNSGSDIGKPMGGYTDTQTKW